eukprot:TRINITY_DN14002_c0_g1_i1.p1 TRINITY_DN14002_c0_g1~~TRINITY_DN14002_c0_g1_i1.p1  ORF type:complete len:208 (+),score=67.30 TRINITY_DN14002_c0_g1_i1:61-684(+)
MEQRVEEEILEALQKLSHPSQIQEIVQYSQNEDQVCWMNQIMEMKENERLDHLNLCSKSGTCLLFPPSQKGKQSSPHEGPSLIKAESVQNDELKQKIQLLRSPNDTTEVVGWIEESIKQRDNLLKSRWEDEEISKSELGNYRERRTERENSHLYRVLKSNLIERRKKKEKQIARVQFNHKQLRDDVSSLKIISERMKRHISLFMPEE